MIRFYLGLWASKILIFILKIFGQEKDDKPGLLAYRFCDDFLFRLKKPEMVVAITGTNGKTTVSSLVANMYKNSGKKVCYNDWGANCLAGHARCLIDAVTIFNRPKVDVAVLEADELTSSDTFPGFNPNYVIVTHISRDSLRRNGNYFYIFERLNEGIKLVPNSKLILNADCPISSFLGDKHEKIFYGVLGNKVNKANYISNDFNFCPRCYGEIKYNYRHYRHIGNFYCPSCGLKSYDADYLVVGHNSKDKTLAVKHNSNIYNYPLISSSIFNIYNQIAVITFFKEVGFTDEEIALGFKQLKIPKSRESSITVNGIELIAQMAKGQNVSACSTVFEQIAKDEDDIVLVFLMNEMYLTAEGGEMETITWFYETDFEFLNKDNIKQILIGGPRNLDYKLRLKLGGFPDDKYICTDDDYELYKYVKIKGIKKIYFLYEVEAVSKAMKIRKQFYDRIIELGGDNNEN